MFRMNILRSTVAVGTSHLLLKDGSPGDVGHTYGMGSDFRSTHIYSLLWLFLQHVILSLFLIVPLPLAPVILVQHFPHACLRLLSASTCF
jgi:hypothetical protein